MVASVKEPQRQIKEQNKYKQKQRKVQIHKTIQFTAVLNELMVDYIINTKFWGKLFTKLVEKKVFLFLFSVEKNIMQHTI